MKQLLILATTLFCLIGCSSSKEENRSQVEISTTKGKILVELYNETPKHRDNFLQLVEDGFYNNLLWHRVIDNFIIQTGDPKSKQSQSGEQLGATGVGYTLPSEIRDTIFHKRGSLSAAHNGNPDFESDGSHFVIIQNDSLPSGYFDAFENYINENLAIYHTYHADSNSALLKAAKAAFNPYDTAMVTLFTDSITKLSKSVSDQKFYSIPDKHIAHYTKYGGAPFNDRLYTVFGEVIEGMNVVDSIATVDTDANSRPIEDIRIISMKILR